MVEGATSFLDREPKPIWIVEISISEHQPKGSNVNPNLLSTFSIFWNKGYEAWTVGKQLRPINPDEVENIARSAKDYLFTHNFLFIEEGKGADIT